VLRIAVNAPTSSLRQHARNSIVGISGVKPPQALVILAFCAAHGGARECPATLPRYYDQTPRLMEQPIWISGHVRMDARWTVTSVATRRHRSKFH
jgi:hypothetical protein